MKEFQGKVAVITGGASGIGHAMAERFAEEGMRIVLADVEESALTKTTNEMKADGAEVISVLCDVSKKEDMKNLADKAVEAYGTVHILCNNAGVGCSGNTWEISLEDWEWIMGVNLWGVIYGNHYFTPIMLANGDPCHIVNTSSFAGLTNGLFMTPYHVTKNSVVSISESMFKELTVMEANIGISVLCPAWVNTRIFESTRNHPAGAPKPGENDAVPQGHLDFVKKCVQDGLSTEHIAQLVMNAIVEEKFYILSHPEWNSMIETRMVDILEERNPTIIMPPQE